MSRASSPFFYFWSNREESPQHALLRADTFGDIAGGEDRPQRCASGQARLETTFGLFVFCFVSVDPRGKSVTCFHPATEGGGLYISRARANLLRFLSAIYASTFAEGCGGIKRRDVATQSHLEQRGPRPRLMVTEAPWLKKIDRFLGDFFFICLLL